MSLLLKRHTPQAGLAPSSLLTGLVSYWKHNEASGSSRDSVGANHLALVGDITTEAGKLGNCRRSSGAGRLFIADNPSQDFSANKSISINGWISLAALPASAATLLGKWDSGQMDFALGYGLAVTAWQFNVSLDGSTAVTASIRATSPALNTFYMLTGVFDFTAGQISLSINGAGTTTKPFSGPIHHGSAPLTAFQILAGSVSANMRVDEVGLWARVLTPAEIATLFNGGAGITHPFS